MRAAKVSYSCRDSETLLEAGRMLEGDLTDL